MFIHFHTFSFYKERVVRHVRELGFRTKCRIGLYSVAASAFEILRWISFSREKTTLTRILQRFFHFSRSVILLYRYTLVFLVCCGTGSYVVGHVNTILYTILHYIILRVRVYYTIV